MTGIARVRPLPSAGRSSQIAALRPCVATPFDAHDARERCRPGARAHAARRSCPRRAWSYGNAFRRLQLVRRRPPGQRRPSLQGRIQAERGFFCVPACHGCGGCCRPLCVFSAATHRVSKDGIRDYVSIRIGCFLNLKEAVQRAFTLTTFSQLSSFALPLASAGAAEKEKLRFLTSEKAEEIRQNFGSPVYVYDANTLRQQARPRKLPWPCPSLLNLGDAQASDPHFY